MRRLIALLCLNLLACNDMPEPADAAGGTDSGPRDRDDAGEMLSDAGDMIDSGPTGMDSGASGCVYPAGAVEPMEVGSVLWPYRWPEAIDGTGANNFPLDLVDVTCNTDENRDWSPFDVLVFIAIPAW